MPRRKRCREKDGTWWDNRSAYHDVQERLEIDAAAARSEHTLDRAANQLAQLLRRRLLANRLQDLAELGLRDFAVAVAVEEVERLLHLGLVGRQGAVHRCSIRWPKVTLTFLGGMEPHPRVPGVGKPSTTRADRHLLRRLSLSRRPHLFQRPTNNLLNPPP